MKNESTYKKAIQDKVDQVHFEYDAAGWESLRKKLPRKPFPFYGKMAIGLAAVSLLTLGVYFGISTKEQKINSNTQTEAPIGINKQNQESAETTVVAESENLEKKKEPSKKEVTRKITEQPEQKVTKELPEKLEARTTNQSKTPQRNKIITTSPPAFEASFISVEKNVICEGDEIVFDLDQTLSEKQHLTLGEQIIFENTPVFIDHAGIYELSLFTNDELTDKKIIKVNNAPSANFTIEKGEEKFAKINYIFRAEDNDLMTYEWTINGERKATSSEVIESFKRSGLVTVELTVKDLNGCSASEIKEINIKETFDLLSYDAFTPDGDGLNDAFIPKAIEANDLKFEMSIFTPSGSPLYTTTDYYQPWNGRRNNTGEKMPPGLYLWKVTAYDEDNQPHSFSGQIRIVQLR
jgi:gliding motility-associated-like protein